MNDLVSAKLVQIADQIQSTLVAKGPAALNLLLATTKWQAIVNLSEGFAWLLGAIFCLFLLTWYLSIVTKATKEEITDEGIIAFLFLSIFIIGFGFLAFWQLADLFNWIGIWHPDIYIAHQLLSKVTS